MNLVGFTFLIFFLGFIVVEIAWASFRKRKVYNLRESLSNAFMMMVNNLIKPLSLAWKFWVFSWIEPWQTFALPQTAWAFLLTFLVVDAAYYWYHRLSHEMPLLWVMHHTHHSSPWMNLTTAFRLNWIANFVGPIFFLPLILLGFNPLLVTLSLALGLFFQFFLHTEAIGKLGWFEGKLLNTPSAHRVHHGSNPQYIDKNYAGALIIWDRIFGTYEAEQEKVKYGVTSGFLGHNPFKIQLLPLWKFLQGNWYREKTLQNQRQKLIKTRIA